MYLVLKKITDGLTKILQFLLIVAMTLLVFDVVWGVLTRYVGGEQASWTEELARFLLIWVALLGGAVAFETKSHLGVDYFVGKFEQSVRRNLQLLSHVVVLFFAISIFILGGGRVVYDALVLNQTTPALGWKMGYIYLVIPVAGCFMVLFTINNLLETLRLGCDEETEKVD
ncbi:TRAP-type C4-dicarboxylate transport system permease small subunit [Rhodopirellula rubra]|uniref:TRAP-type C4-dicarboxylate transport system permease small subunit n=1 Tax=Aporhodopirellula rubra TaxID=980271 RepID=A0A7W5H8F4_9BACT|nr:TRAP transporter small permease [Aporhodopirellula rubra]MBB3209379.1 TRAP-type C4-dicarboxylate transport system permease small subunit [Aporhodopirellula rubra]